MDTLQILVINPGSTSTKLAYFEGEKAVFEEMVEHPEDELIAFKDIASQEGYRLGLVEKFMKDRAISPAGLSAVVARGGLMKPVKSGVYKVNFAMVEDLKGSKKRWGREHASNLGCLIAYRLAERYMIPAFTADPVTVDEMDEVARISGVPEITRKSHLHALNIKAATRRAAKEMGKPVSRLNFVVAHVGGGVSVAAVRGGAIIDVNNALLGMGPFSPQRAGALPTGDLIDLAYSGRYDRAALEKKLVKESGLTGYLGTPDVREVERRIESGDREAALVFVAMAYQLGKEIAAMASALAGNVDAVILTGGVVNSKRFTDMVTARVGFIAAVRTYPGEAEMESLAYYARAALTGTEKARDYE